MAAGEPRRSQRLGTYTYQSNGRDYLCSKLRLNRSQFEEWLYSSTVRPHLQQWHLSCIRSPGSFNEGIAWINTGKHGYYYSENDLEEDVLFKCLGAGNDGQLQECGESVVIDFASETKDTTKWLTQELWAIAAWRVVQANGSEGQVFEAQLRHHPAAAYAFAIEMLCIIFHSIAFRGAASVYWALLEGGRMTEITYDMEGAKVGGLFAADDFDAASSGYTSTSSSNDADRSSDATFIIRKRKRADSERSTIILPAKVKEDEPEVEDIGSDIQVKRRKVAKASTVMRSSLSVFSSVEETGRPEPHTPDTSASVTGTFGKMEVPKDEQFQKWLSGVSMARASRC